MMSVLVISPFTNILTMSLERRNHSSSANEKLKLKEVTFLTPTYRVINFQNHDLNPGPSEYGNHS